MYRCEFPGCDYVCEGRSQIHEHHIIPKKLNGSNKKSNKIYVCPNCHTRIYVPGMRNGIHSIKNKDSIIINGWLGSTNGRVLEYINSSGNIDYYFMKEMS